MSDSHFPPFFRVFLANKDVKTVFSGSFTSFSSLTDPKKGCENEEKQRFHILRVFGKDVKMREYGGFPPFWSAALTVQEGKGCENTRIGQFHIPDKELSTAS